MNEFPVISFMNEASIFFKVQQYSEKSEHRDNLGRRQLKGESQRISALVGAKGEMGTCIV